MSEHSLTVYARAVTRAPAPVDPSEDESTAEHPDRPRPGRAAPLHPDERRSAVLGAVVPLLLERGPDVSTRELAAAAGVAEGTLFRVFPDKASILRAAIAQALDPTDLVDDLARLAGQTTPTPATRPTPQALSDVLVAATDLLLSRARTVSGLIAVIHELPGTAERPGPAPHAPGHGHGHGRGNHQDAGPLAPVVAAVAGLVEPYAPLVRRDPGVCARFLVAMTMTVARPRSGDLELAAGELVDLVLRGLLVPTDPAMEAPC